jgi:hypothetical protein
LQRVLDAFDDTPMFPNAAHLIASSEFNFWPRTLARLPENRQSFAAGAKRRLKRVLERLESVAPGQRHWMPAADHHDALGAAAMRRGLLDKLATDRQRVIGFHLPFPGVGRVERRGSAYHFVPQWPTRNDMSKPWRFAARSRASTARSGGAPGRPSAKRSKCWSVVDCSAARQIVVHEENHEMRPHVGTCETGCRLRLKTEAAIETRITQYEHCAPTFLASLPQRFPNECAADTGSLALRPHRDRSQPKGFEGRCHVREHGVANDPSSLNCD